MRRTRASAGGELKNTQDCFICWEKTDKTDQFQQSFVFKLSKLPLLGLLSEALCQEIEITSHTVFNFCNSCKTLLNDYDHGIWLVKRSQTHLQKILKERALKFQEEPIFAADAQELEVTEACSRDDGNEDDVVQEPASQVIEVELVSDGESNNDHDADGFNGPEPHLTLKSTRKYEKRKKADHECNLCCAQFKSDNELKNHEALHEGLDPLQCPICHKQLGKKGALVRHMYLHTGEKQYVCSRCGKSFIHHMSFHIHSLAHDNIREKKCEICSKLFYSTSHLNRHLKVHTGAKPWKCHCGKEFAQRYNLTVHQKGHEGIKVKRKKKSPPVDLILD